MIGLGSIVLDIPGIEFDSDQDGVRYWQTAPGDMLGLWHIPMPPDLAAPPKEIDTLRACYRRMVTEAGMAIISVDPTEVDGCTAVRTIFKMRRPEENSLGVLYIASITIPFREFSFVLKTICGEQGITGLRDAVIANTLLSDGKIGIGPSGFTGWFADPYDPSFRADFLANLSDDVRYDEKFPDHPLSRARRLLRTLEEGAKVSEEAKSAEPFIRQENP